MGNWRAQLPPEYRGKNVNKIFLTIKKKLPNSSQIAQRDIWKMAVRSEKNIYFAATSKSDYSRKISLKLLALSTTNFMPSDHARHKRNREYFRWTFAFGNVILEGLSAAADQLSSPNKPRYAAIGLLISFTCMAFCIGEVVYKAREAEVTLKRLKRIWWFFYPPPVDMPFGTFTDIFGPICAILQCIFSILQYAYCSQESDNPIKISALPLIFAICVACSRFFHQTEDPLHIGTASEDDSILLPLTMEEGYFQYMFGNSI